MKPQQNSTSDPALTNIPRPYEMLTEVQRAFVDYKALGGLITDHEGHIKKLTVTDLAKMMGVDRTAFYDSQKYVPNFWELVSMRRKQLGSESRLSRFHQTWYLKAIKMENWPLAEAWLRNFDTGYRESHVKVEHGLSGGLADLLNKARTRREEGAIEGEVVDYNVPTGPTDTPRS